jgi:histidinol dehydrogenase
MLVATAKRRVFGIVGIDMVAGPSEILVVSDGSGNPDWVAMDLFSQAEHDELAQSILICTDAGFIDQVQVSIEKLLPTMPRADTIRTSLNNRGAFILVRDMDEAVAIANRVAPEHLELSLADPDPWVAKIHHAGAIFIGHYTSEALGDYCAGPNHVLPTSGSARFSSPLGVYDFQKRTSLIKVSRAGAQTLGRIASTLAHGEVCRHTPSRPSSDSTIERNFRLTVDVKEPNAARISGRFFGVFVGRPLRLWRCPAFCPAHAG